MQTLSIADRGHSKSGVIAWLERRAKNLSEYDAVSAVIPYCDGFFLLMRNERNIVCCGEGNSWRSEEDLCIFAKHNLPETCF